ncbi:hypothetical protein HER32_00235 [Hymenobacter sp. BT18]|uniref:hypothetical protein n=1 Tax=Hymenobacter sp. BT18 TaxID=2835648 RepID=UPI00143E818B|nr:hypothetical protein [Hymenobacter sp. BT18]QIX59703.1 hypothetical protein HER32_00235 [Hymenobacter sp. BT18]
MDYEVQNVRIHNWNIKTPGDLGLRALIRFSNPSSVQFKVDSVALNIYHQGALIGDCFINTPTVIAPKSFSLQEYPLRLRLVPIATALWPIIRDNKPLPAVDVTGYVKIAGIDQQIAVTVPLAAYDPRQSLPAKKTANGNA